MIGPLLAWGLAAAHAGAGWELPGAHADSGLEVSEDGRFVVVSVRRVDTDGDGDVDLADHKSLLLLERGRESYCFGEGLFEWRDKMPRFEPGGARLALAAPGLARGWTPWDPSDVVVFDPGARVELARYPDGINPVWLWGGALAFQRDDRVVIASAAGLVELDPAAVVDGDEVRLRGLVADPARRRLLASFSAKPAWAGRVAGQGPEDRNRGVIVQLAERDGAWTMERLPWEGFMPVPTADGLYAFRPRSDHNGSGRYEVAADGVDLVRDGLVVKEDVVFHGLYDLDGARVALARRDGGFTVEAADAPRTLTAGLASASATGLVEHGPHAVLVGQRSAAASEGPALFRWSPAGALTALVPAPARRPVPRAAGLFYLRVSGEAPGALVFTPWTELPGGQAPAQPGR